jgi:hypothetical protein
MVIRKYDVSYFPGDVELAKADCAALCAGDFRFLA